MKNKTYQTGMTLIEIMIALLIGAFLLGGVLQIFISSKQTYRMQENLSRLQENGRFAMEFLSRDIRMAGYWDCMAPSTANNDSARQHDLKGGVCSRTFPCR
jgi:type IV pilus assembly protein PilW